MSDTRATDDLPDPPPVWLLMETFLRQQILAHGPIGLPNVHSAVRRLLAAKVLDGVAAVDPVVASFVADMTRSNNAALFKKFRRRLRDAAYGELLQSSYVRIRREAEAVATTRYGAKTARWRATLAGYQAAALAREARLKTEISELRGRPIGEYPPAAAAGGGAATGGLFAEPKKARKAFGRLQAQRWVDDGGPAWVDD